MSFLIQDGKFLIRDGKFAVDCNCECDGGCVWYVQLIAYSLEDTNLAYGSQNGGAVCWRDNTPVDDLDIFDPVFEPDTLNGTITGSATLRLWGSPENITVTTGAADATFRASVGETICVNGVEIDENGYDVSVGAGPVVFFPVDYTLVGGDQSGYGGGTTFNVTCGACP